MKRSTETSLTPSGQRIGIVLLGLSLLAIGPLAAQGTAPADPITPLAMKPGAPAGSFPLSGFETVNLYNGNLNFALPLLHIQGRGEAEMTLTLVIERHWQLRVVSPEGIGHPAKYAAESMEDGRPRYGGAMFRRITQQDLEFQNSRLTFHHSLTRLTFMGPDGTETDFRDDVSDGQPRSWAPSQSGFNRGRVWLSRDGSAARFTTPTDVLDPGEEVVGYPTSLISGTLQLASGTTYDVEGLVKRIRDRNGNRIDLEYDPAWRLRKVVDSLGREVHISYPSAFEDRIEYRGFRDTPRTIVVRYAPLEERLREGEIGTQTALFPGVLFANSDEPVNPRVVSEVELPNDTKYDFEYNPYAELTRVMLPTGGVIEYTWKSGVPGSSAGIHPLGAVTGSWDYGVHRRVASRTVRNYNIEEQKQEFEAEPYPCADPECWVDVEEHDPVAGRQIGHRRHWFVGHPIQSFLRRPVDYAGWKEGREVEVDIFEGESEDPVRRRYNTWQQRAPVAWWNDVSRANEPANDVRLTRVKTTEGALNARVDFGYDDYNNVVSKQEFHYDSAVAARTTQTTYMGEAYVEAHLLRLPKETWVSDPLGERSRTRLGYDDYGEFPLVERPGIVGWTAPSSLRGNVTTIERHQDWEGESEWVKTRSAYDVAGNVVRIVDPRDYATRIFYEDDYGLPNGQLQEQAGRNTFAFPTLVRNAMNHETRTQYDYHTGKVVDRKDPNGTLTSLYFDDPLDRLALVVKAANQGAQSYRSKLAFGYDDGRTLRRVTSYGDHNEFEDAYSQHRVTYDELGRELLVSDRDPEGTLGHWITVEKRYDGRGRLFNVTLPRFDRDTYQAWTTTTFDALDRPVGVRTPDGAIVQTSYVDNVTTVTDPANKVRTSVTDALGRVVSVTEGVGELDYVTSYEYDAHDRLTRVEQVSPSGQTVQNRTFTYDSLGQLRDAANPESGLVRYGYDLAGNLVERRDARSVVTLTRHDQINRPFEITYSDGTPQVNLTYDVDSVPGTFPVGHLTKVSNGVSETTYRHDPLGRVFQSTQKTEGVTYPFGYRYDLLGNLVKERYPSGRVVSTPHDYLSRVTEVFDATRKYASLYCHSPHGVPVSLKLGNALWETTRFNYRLQPTLVGLGTAPDQLEPDFLSLSYEYWPGGSLQANNGNVFKQTILAPGGPPMVQSYTYDGANRLKTATETGAWSQTYDYDRFGNRRVSAGFVPQPTSTPTSANHFDPAMNRLTLGLSQYDDAGNLTRDPAGQLSTYDAESRTVTANSGNVTYRYDGEGRRVIKQIGTEKTIYVYDALGRLASEYGGLPVFAGVRYLTKDPLGSTRVVTDQSGTVVGRHDFLPFGEEIPKTLVPRPQIGAYEGLDAVRHRFTGKERDFETGRDYFGARYFSGAQGRFTSVDPKSAGADLLNPQTWNGYAYTLNNPLRHVDPNGKAAKDVLNGSINFAKHAVVGFYSFLLLALDEGGSQRLPGIMAEPFVVAAQEYGVKGVQGVGEQLLAQGEAGATEIATEAILFGGSAIAPFTKAGPARPGLTPEAGALGEELAGIAGRPSSRRPATVVGATQTATGETVVGRSSPGKTGCCAEVDAAGKLGGDPRTIRFTKPVRPRTGEIIPVCKNCQQQFDPRQFPPGTPFED